MKLAKHALALINALLVTNCSIDFFMIINVNAT